MLDSLSEIRLLAQSSLRYRRQILALKHYFAQHGATVLLLDDLTTEAHDKTVHSVAHGVIRLEELAPDYGAERRRLRVVKYRGAELPRRLSRLHHQDRRRAACSRAWSRPSTAATSTRDTLSSGIAELDAAARRRPRARLEHADPGPGRHRQVAARRCTSSSAAVARGEKAALFVFDEELGLLFDRAKGLGIDLEAMRDSGKLLIEQIDAAELSPGEFAHRVRAARR